MYAKIENNKIVKFPYSLNELRASHRDVSFGDEINDETLAHFGIVRVVQEQSPEFDYTVENRVTDVVLTDGIWKQVWNLEKLPLEVATQNIKVKRNTLLAATDWRFRSDQSPTQEWIDYCQALRDITDSKDYPYNIEWPTEPK